MTNIIKLKSKFKDSGMTVTAIAEKAGILRETLYNRLNVNADFKASEIVSLTKVLNLTEKERNEIFFNN
jgi:DNA-binding phage protein